MDSKLYYSRSAWRSLIQNWEFVSQHACCFGPPRISHQICSSKSTVRFYETVFDIVLRFCIVWQATNSWIVFFFVICRLMYFYTRVIWWYPPVSITGENIPTSVLIVYLKVWIFNNGRVLGRSPAETFQTFTRSYNLRGRQHSSINGNVIALTNLDYCIKQVMPLKLKAFRSDLRSGSHPEFNGFFPVSSCCQISSKSVP